MCGTRELTYTPYQKGVDSKIVAVPNTMWTVEYDENPRFILVTGSMMLNGKLKQSKAIPYFPQFPLLVFTYHGPRAAGRRTRKSKRRARKTRRRIY